MSQKTSQVCKVIHMSELHCSLESNVRANVRDAADTYKMRPKCKVSPAEPRAWGGINILFFVDFWQLPPVRQTAIFHNPFEVAKPDHRVNRIMRMFWSRDTDAMNMIVELTQAKRQKEGDWFYKFIRECRHGVQSEEMYNFIHGFPTTKTGSWMPNDSSYTLLCGNEQCYKLCDEIWPRMRQQARPWKNLEVTECEICQAHRKKRCRVQLNDADERQLHKPFTDAPYLHPFNQPRYHALIVRSQLFARANNRILLWYIAIDKPYQGVDESLRGDALQRRREKWLEYSDDKTAGMMGLLPLVRGMPMRCTATINREQKLFKHARCVLEGIELDSMDEGALKHCQESQYVLQTHPKALHVRLEKGDGDADRAHEVHRVEIAYRSWSPDAANNVKVRRLGFELVPNFAGTIHSFVGATLPAGILDCLHVTRTPSRDDMLKAYLGISRTLRHCGIRNVTYVRG